MKIHTKAALLSALAFPGVGQIHLGRYGRGIAIVMLTLGTIGIIVGIAVVQALAVLETLQHQNGAIDVQTITQEASRAVSSSSSAAVSFCFAFLIAIWLFSIIDAYILGSRHREHQRP